MVILDLIALTGLPVAISTIEGSRHQKSKERNVDEEEQLRLRDFNLRVFCDADSRKKDEVNDTCVILRDGRLFLSKPKFKSAVQKRKQTQRDHLFRGFFLSISPPTSTQQSSSSRSWNASDNRASASMNLNFTRLNKPPSILGLVSTIPPQIPQSLPSSSRTEGKKKTKEKEHKKLNWIFVDPDNFQLKYAPNAQNLYSQGKLLGPWNWTSSQNGGGLLLEGWEGFVAVEESSGIWGIYYDRDDDLLRDRQMVGGRRVLRISLERRVIDDDDDEDAEESEDEEESDEERRVQIEWEIEEIE